MAIFKNIVKLRGFLGRDAEGPTGKIEMDSFAVLLLATESGTWDVATNEWKSRLDWHHVICPGPRFCGFTRGMRRGEYLEIQGELRAHEQKRSVMVAGESFPVSRSSYAVHATGIRRLDRPLVFVNTGEDG